MLVSCYSVTNGHTEFPSSAYSLARSSAGQKAGHSIASLCPGSHSVVGWRVSPGAPSRRRLLAEFDSFPAGCCQLLSILRPWLCGSLYPYSKGNSSPFILEPASRELLSPFYITPDDCSFEYVVYVLQFCSFTELFLLF